MKRILSVVAGVVIVFMSAVVCAEGEGVAAWLNTSAPEGAPAVTAVAAETAPAAVVETSAPVVQENATTTITLNKGITGVVTTHDVGDVIAKLTSAQIGLEGYGDDLNGHRVQAIDYLKQALNILQGG